MGIFVLDSIFVFICPKLIQFGDVMFRIRNIIICKWDLKINWSISYVKHWNQVPCSRTRLLCNVAWANISHSWLLCYHCYVSVCTLWVCVFGQWPQLCFWSWPLSKIPLLWPGVNMFSSLWRYGFVEFDDPRDADDAVYDLNGKELCGERVIVEHTKGPRRDGGYGGGGGGGGGGRSKCSVKYCTYFSWIMMLRDFILYREQLIKFSKGQKFELVLGGWSAFNVYILVSAIQFFGVTHLILILCRNVSFFRWHTELGDVMVKDRTLVLSLYDDMA